MLKASFFQSKCSGTTFISWIVAPLVSLHLKHMFFDGYTEVVTEGHGVVFVTIVRTLHSSKCMERRGISVACLPCWVVLKVLSAKEKRLKLYLFFMWIPAAWNHRTCWPSFVLLVLTGVQFLMLSIDSANVPLAGSLLGDTMWKCMPFALSTLAITCLLPWSPERFCRPVGCCWCSLQPSILIKATLSWTENVSRSSPLLREPKSPPVLLRIPCLWLLVVH